LRYQLKPCIHAAIRDNPDLAVQGKWLVFTFRFSSHFEQRVTEPYVATDPDVLRVWAAKFLKVHEPLEQTPIDRRAVKMNDASEAAHDCSELCSGNAASKVA
jgi:hypothetical protein